MNYDNFLHICRAVLEITKAREVIVFGFNAIIPWLKDKDMDELPVDKGVVSRELDVTVGNEELDTLIDATLGEGSMFDKTYHYYAHGTGLEGCIIPKDWRLRANNITHKETGAVIFVPHPHDILVSKLVAGREKDFEFAKALQKIFPASPEYLETVKKQLQREYPDYAEKAEIGIEKFMKRMDIELELEL
jgi:hypothetical protein